MNTLAAEPKPGLEVIEALSSNITNISFLRANSVELLIDGAATYDAMIRAIESADSYVLVQFYIVRDDSVGRRLRDALIEQARRGVDVRIILPDKADQHIVELASYTYYDVMLKSGVCLYRYRERFMHQKVILVDDIVAGVGTVNLDNRSLYLNFEATALVADDAFIQQIEAMLTEDLENSVPVMREHYYNKSLPFRVASQIARLASPLL